jgi:hypothetical protein
MGEFVTYRALYRLIVQKLVEVVGKKEEAAAEKEDEEEVVLRIVFDLYNRCFFKIRSIVEEIVGEENGRFPSFAAQYRTGLQVYFSGAEPNSELAPSFEKFLNTVRSQPVSIRYYKLMSGLESMLSEQLEYVFQLVGVGPFRDVVTKVKKEIAEPLAIRRELVKRYSIEDSFYKTIKRADKVVKMIRG